MRLVILVVFVTTYLVPVAAARERIRTHQFRVLTSWSHTNNEAHSSNHLVGRFSATVTEEQMVKVFQLLETGYVVTVGVEGVRDSLGTKPGLERLRMAVAVGRQPAADVFDALNSAILELPIQKSYEWSTVRTRVRIDDEVYDITFGVSDSR